MTWIFALNLTDDIDIGAKEKVLPQGIRVKYESFITNYSKAKANVIFFLQTNRQTDKPTGQNPYAPDLSIWVHRY